MPSQLYSNDAIYFLAAKPFTYNGEEYSIGDEFPQEKANNIETMIRARFVIPVVDDIKDKPRHWHTHVRTREQADQYLNRDLVQLVWPSPPDSDEVVNLETLTHPELVEPPEESGEADPSDDDEPGVSPEAYDPGEHTVQEVLDYIEAHPDEAEQIRSAEAAGKNRKGIVEGY